ncbi:MAG TPA: NAD-dependent epimerase/dehydratase family protein, partial [Candidatus Hydrogenedentes bacterium]|nr:NAD-dependent epimerase/dehydratase family protein [Candidatus Hydrogenedentota bacterium]
NLTGTVNCLEAARRHEAGILFLSTSRVYPYAAINSLAYRKEESRFVLEDQQPLPGASARGIAEDFPLDGARSLYGATKLCSEFLVREYIDMYGMPGVINRCGVITGPWQMGKIDQGVVVLWVARHIYGGRLDYIGFGGTGKQVRDMLHIDDLVRLVLHEAAHLKDLSGALFNVGGGTEGSASLCELTELCRERTGNRIPIGGVPENRPADVRLYVTDNTQVTAATGWRPEKDVKAIVADVAAWISEHRDPLEPILG